MSKFLSLGIDLENVIKMTTINPAIALGMEDNLGSITEGMPADITIVNLVKGDWIFEDSFGKLLRGEVLFTPVQTISNGKCTPVEFPVRSIQALNGRLFSSAGSEPINNNHGGQDPAFQK